MTTCGVQWFLFHKYHYAERVCILQGLPWNSDLFSSPVIFKMYLFPFVPSLILRTTNIVHDPSHRKFYPNSIPHRLVRLCMTAFAHSLEKVCRAFASQMRTLRCFERSQDSNWGAFWSCWKPVKFIIKLWHASTGWSLEPRLRCDWFRVPKGMHCSSKCSKIYKIDC